MALDPIRAVANARQPAPLTRQQVRSVSLRRTTPRATIDPRQAILANPKLSGAARALLEQTTPGAKQSGRSILGQISDTITGAPKGLVHLATNAAKNVIAPERIVVDVLKGDLDPNEAMHAFDPNRLIHGGTDRDRQLAHKYFPLTGELTQSVDATAGRLAQLGPVEVNSVGGNKVQTYGDLARSPNGLVSGILNDVGNVTLAGGAVSKVAGSAAAAADAAGHVGLAESLGRVASRAEGISQLGGKVANAPFAPYGMAARGGRSLIGRVLDTGAGAAGLVERGGGPVEASLRGLSDATAVANPYDSVTRRVGQEAKALAEETLRRISDKPGREGMAERGSLFLTDTGKRLKEAMRDSRIEPARIGRKEQARLVKTAIQHGAPSAAEAEAAAAILNGVGRADFEASKLIGADASLASHAGGTEHDIRPGHTMTSEGQKLVHDYHNGVLPAEQVARIQSVMQAEGEAVARKTAKALEGHGSFTGPLDPAYLGDELLMPAVEQHLRDANVPDTDIATMHDLLAEGHSLHDIATVIPELNDVLLDPQVYPTAWREAMHVTSSATDAGATGLPRTPQEMLDAGWDRPTYLPSPEIRSVAEQRVWRPGDVATTEGFGSGLRGVGSEMHRSTLGTGPYSLATFAEALNRGIRQTEFNHSLLDFVMADETKSVGDIIRADPALQGTGLSPADAEFVQKLIDDPPPSDPDMPPVDYTDPLEQLRALADKHVAGRDPFNKMDKRTFASKAREEFGRLLHDEVIARKHDVLPGNRADPKVGDFDMSATVDARKIDPETVALPIGLKERAVRYTTGKNRNDLISGLDWAHSKLKGQVLAYSTRWQIGDAVGVQLMSWVGGGINPARLISAMQDLHNMTPEATKALFDHDNFVESGIRHEDIAAQLRPDFQAKTPTLGRGLIKSKSFQLNQWINASGRQGFVLAKVQRVLDEYGLDPTKPGNESAWQEPEVKAAIDDAVNDANRVFGTIDDLSPFEQRVVKNILWFWPWTRHITGLALRTAIDNPARILWTMRLGALGAQDDGTLPEFLRGALKGPGGYWSPNFLNPINDVGTGNLLSPDAAARQLSPVYKIGVAALLNRDANRNFNVISHAPGTSPNRLVSALYQGLKTSPLTRSALDLAPTGSVGSIGLGPHKRYGSGQIIRNPDTGRPSTTTSRWRAALIGAPLPTPSSDVAGAQAAGSGTKALTLRRAGGKHKTLKLRH